MILAKEVPPHDSRIFSCLDYLPESVVAAAARHHCVYERTDVIFAYNATDDTVEALCFKVDKGRYYHMMKVTAATYETSGGVGFWVACERPYHVDLLSLPHRLRDAAKELVLGTRGEAT